MIKIRKGVFETNSSSTHSMVIVPDNDKEYYVLGWDDEVFTKEELIDYLKEGINNYNRENPSDEKLFPENADLCTLVTLAIECSVIWEDEKPQTIEQWLDSDYLENDTTYYKTPGGEDLIIYSKFGRDG